MPTVRSSRHLACLLLLLTLAACGEEAAPANTAQDMAAPDMHTPGVDQGAPARDMAPDMPAQDMPVDMAPDMTPLDMAPDMEPDMPPAPRTFLDAYALPVSFAESGTYDPIEHRFYVGSLETGGVYQIDAQTGMTSAWYTEERPGEWWTLGLDVDPVRRVLWVCSMADLRDVGEGDPANAGYILKLDLETGALIRRFDLGETFPTATCADVAVAEDGSAYVCDRSHPNIYKIDAQEQVTLFATSEVLSGEAVGQNALIVLPDQSGLLSVVYLMPTLAHISLTDGAVKEVAVQGNFFDFVPAFSGADGMTWSGDGALVTFSSQTTRITPTSPDWSTAVSVAVDTASGMTDIVHTPAGDFLLNGQPLTFATQGQPDPTQLVLFDERP